MKARFSKVPPKAISASPTAGPARCAASYGDHERFIQTYFSTYKGKYFTGDGSRRDEDGYYWITGRVDDVLNVSWHRLGTAEVKSALVSHSLVSEAVVVGYPHPIKGQAIYCFITLTASNEGSDELRHQLVKHVRSESAVSLHPIRYQFAHRLPKTRSGKIMRRILRKIAENDFVCRLNLYARRSSRCRRSHHQSKQQLGRIKHMFGGSKHHLGARELKSNFSRGRRDPHVPRAAGVSPQRSRSQIAAGRL